MPGAADVVPVLRLLQLAPLARCLGRSRAPGLVTVLLPSAVVDVSGERVVVRKACARVVLRHAPITEKHFCQPNLRRPREQDVRDNVDRRRRARSREADRHTGQSRVDVSIVVKRSMEIGYSFQERSVQIS